MWFVPSRRFVCRRRTAYLSIPAQYPCNKYRVAKSQDEYTTRGMARSGGERVRRIEKPF